MIIIIMNIILDNNINKIEKIWLIKIDNETWYLESLISS